MIVRLENMDCMDLMAEYPDKYFDLACVDVPYGIGASDYERGGTQYGHSKAPAKIYDRKNWDFKTPDKMYFDELIRISKNQIIFGANHFISKIPFDSSCWIVWDKMRGEGSGYADCELAYTSFKTAVRRCYIRWAGMLQYDMKNKEIRIHPTQKPIKLYEWIYNNYAKHEFKVIDTHGGSMSSLIAAENFGLQEFVICELDKDYFEAGKKRYENHISNIRIL